MRGIGDNSGPRDVFQVSRKIFDHPLVGAGNGGVDPWSKMEAWEWLLATARYKPGEIVVRGHTVTIEVGQLMTTFSGLAERWKWTARKVQIFLEKLQEAGMIDRDTGAHNSRSVNPNVNENVTSNVNPNGTPKGIHSSIITICNYGVYQFLEDYLRQRKSEQERYPEGEPERQPAGQHKKKEEEGNNNIKIPAHAREGIVKPWSQRDAFALNRWQAKAHEDCWFDEDHRLQVANGFRADLENILEDPSKLRSALDKAAGWVGISDPPEVLKTKVRAQVQRQVDDLAMQNQRFDRRYGAPPEKAKTFRGRPGR